MRPQKLSRDWTVVELAEVQTIGGGDQWTPEPLLTRQRPQTHSVWSVTVVNMYCVVANSGYEVVRTRNKL